MSLTISNLKEQNLILLECVSGSRAYGLATASSDTDIKGVFYLPKNYYYGLHGDYIAQVSNETNDEVYYELGRFVELLLKNNPTVMELLATPADKIIYQNPLIKLLKPDYFISELCRQTFVGFAKSQIKKARGLNKKIVNPMVKDKKNLLDFCTVFVDGKSVRFNKWLANFNSDNVEKSDKSADLNNLVTQRQFGLASMPHAQQMYAMYHDTNNEYNFSGIIQQQDISQANQVSLSSIPQGMKPIAYLAFNQMGYSKYCHDYSEYWTWVDKRNEQRYQTTINHGKQYDAKNMMHTIRLLQVASNIVIKGKVIVECPNREELLAIKEGKLEYDELLTYVDTLSADIEANYNNCQLPESPDKDKVLATLVDIRNQLY